VRPAAVGIHFESSDAIFLVGVEASRPVIKVRQRRMSEALQLKVPNLGILGCTSVHFFESRHGSAGVFASGVS
jgi:hypothetical protein